ncbi:hypothetical protein B0H63DRAFT_564361 [Podospora didyma]|uniref:Uncharacterized protein n=1 Tax=Podospora didyma TaxID=330526 RepID=A0AAE0K5P0_9PEZI|nr:hypothetical protein B0H63DRAFT_564361 [Podospora didyma]
MTMLSEFATSHWAAALGTWGLSTLRPMGGTMSWVKLNWTSSLSSEHRIHISKKRRDRTSQTLVANGPEGSSSLVGSQLRPALNPGVQAMLSAEWTRKLFDENGDGLQSRASIAA